MLNLDTLRSYNGINGLFVFFPRGSHPLCAFNAKTKLGSSINPNPTTNQLTFLGTWIIQPEMSFHFNLSAFRSFYLPSIFHVFGSSSTLFFLLKLIHLFYHSIHEKSHLEMMLNLTNLVSNSCKGINILTGYIRCNYHSTDVK